MRKKILIGGILCGVMSALCIFVYMQLLYQEVDLQRDETLKRYGGDQVEVLVATRNLNPGETLSDANSAKRTWLSDLLPQNAVQEYSDVAGQEVTSLILAGEVISQDRFEGADNQFEIPEGFVAISVPAKNVQSVGGSITAGSVVDVYATGAQTSCLGTGVLVLATSIDSDSQENAQISWVTLAVKPEKSQEFVTASQSMDLYFTLPATKKETKEAGGDG